MTWYLIVENGAPAQIANAPIGEHYSINEGELILDAYTMVDGAPVYDATYAIASSVRQQRNAILASTDWTQARDIPDETALKWQPYRQALRDLTAQAGFPTNVTWPTEP